MGLDVYISGDGLDETPSKSHPEHYWKLGYYRSSYNDGGFNTVVSRLTGEDLYSLLDPISQNYEFIPTRSQLQVCLNRAKSLQRDFAGLKDRAFSVSSESPFLMGNDSLDTTAEQAIALLNGQLDKRVPDNEWGNNFSNRDGAFFLDGLTVLAAVRGKDVLKRPCVHLIYRLEDEGFTFYSDALDILVESLEAQIALPEGSVSYAWSS